MQRIITIGKNNQKNNYPIEQGVVSQQHLRATVLSDTEILIEDLNSTNGTFVNGERVISIIINPRTDTVRLASPTHTGILLEWTKILEAVPVPPDPLLFQRAMPKLRTVWNEHEAKTEAIKATHRTKTNTIRIVLAGSSIFLTSILYIAGHPELSMIVGGLSAVINAAGIAYTSNMTPEKELKELQRQFVSAYSCPKEGCRQPLSYPPDYYEHQKKACPCGKLKIQ